MRSIAVAGSVLALTGLGGAPALAHQTTRAAVAPEQQHGIVLECTGVADGLSAYVDLYENDKHGNYFQVILDGDPELAASREPKDILDKGDVKAAVRIKGHRARVSGTAHRVGRRTHVHEEMDDAGNSIVSDGFHRRLANDLVLSYRGTTLPLTCDPAFYFSLEVTKTPITE